VEHLVAVVASMVAVEEILMQVEVAVLEAAEQFVLYILELHDHFLLQM
jgi:hypothetical protein